MSEMAVPSEANVRQRSYGSTKSSHLYVYLHLLDSQARIRP